MTLLSKYVVHTDKQIGPPSSRVWPKFKGWFKPELNLCDTNIYNNVQLNFIYDADFSRGGVRVQFSQSEVVKKNWINNAKDRYCLQILKYA